MTLGFNWIDFTPDNIDFESVRPVRATESASGWDLRACLQEDRLVIPPSSTAIVPCGVGIINPIKS